MPIIKFNSVSKNFTEESFAVSDVTFSVEPGEIIFITGPSGSGKTTLMRLLTREYTPTAGEIYFKDEPLSELSAGNVHQHRRKIGVVFQDYQLVPEMNVWENIALPLYVSGKKDAEVEQRVTDLLNLIKLPEKADQFPSQLSGGEAQRVSIARALSIGPELIFADEPTGNLDSDTSKAIARLLKKINELGTTILIATHDQEIMHEHSDLRHIKLENGSLIFDGKATTKKDASSSKKASSKLDSVKSKEQSKKSVPEKKEATSIINDEPKEDLKIETKKQSFWSSLFKKKTPVPKKEETESTEEKSAEKDVKKNEESNQDKNSKDKKVEKSPAKDK